MTFAKGRRTVPDKPIPVVEFGSYRPEVAPPDLAGEILRLRGEIDAFIDGKVMEIKASRDGASLPVPQIRSMVLRNDDCMCRVALNILVEQTK